MLWACCHHLCQSVMSSYGGAKNKQNDHMRSTSTAKCVLNEVQRVHYKAPETLVVNEKGGAGTKAGAFTGGITHT